MKLEALEIQSVRQAIEIFLEISYPEDPLAHWPDLPLDEGDVRRCLDAFEDDSHYLGESKNQRFVLRLGNERYPHTKLAIEEFLLRGEFFFSVDTHDQLDIRPEWGDYAAWQGLKQYNRELKERIEARWREVEIPTMQDLQEALASDPEQPSTGPSSTILLVDDDPDIRKTMEILLRKNGYEVRLASDGVEALAALQDFRPDLMILDFLMPRMDGYEVCRSIRSDPDLAGITILLTTATSLRMEQIEIADGFLLKPFQARVLLDYVSHLLRGDVRKAVLLRRHAPDPSYAARVKTERMEHRGDRFR